MNVTVERVGNDATLKITLPAEEVNKGYKKAVAKIAGQVNIPGFRKGKAPRKRQSPPQCYRNALRQRSRKTGSF